MGIKTRHSKNKIKGFVLPFIAAIGFGIAILVLYIAQAVKIETHQMVYFNNMNKAYRLAESGLNVALGQLSASPRTGYLTGGPVFPEGQYQNYAEPINAPVLGGYYILTTATITASGKTYACAVHTYAKIANIGEYFAALKNEFILSPGMNATGGKIYSPNLVFITTAAAGVPATLATQADYVYSAIASDNGTEFDDPTLWGSTFLPNPPFGNYPIGARIIPDEICIGIGCADLPNRLQAPIQFPQLFTEDFEQYEAYAGAHANFSGGDFRNAPNGGLHIFPPGYEGPVLAGDAYGGHDSSAGSNSQHVWYSDTDIKIGNPDPLSPGTTIHGQVLFVTPGNIEIYGDIYSAADTDPLPGAGLVSSSTAHQAVFIAGGDIKIMTSDLSIQNLPNIGDIRTIEAFFFFFTILDNLDYFFAVRKVIINCPIIYPVTPFFSENFS
jgi:hypothetical protein